MPSILPHPCHPSSLRKSRISLWRLSFYHTRRHQQHHLRLWHLDNATSDSHSDSPISINDFQRTFSSGGLTGMKRRNRLKEDVFESLQLLKSAYRNGHISAASDAEQHLDSLIAALHDEDDEDVALV
ncbi:hypothetical protein EV424DRAFT_1542678 [Suillus variegatus]|nr:hypothetical protein EV424DRAFT_1542678 [Suillus variegatus]